MRQAVSKAERTRSLIIEKTADVFNRKGFAGTSLSDLTEATGLTKGSIYGNFANKEEVAVAAFDFNCFKVMEIVRMQVDKAATFQEKLLVHAKVYRKLLGPDFTGCPIQNTAIEADDTNPVLKARAAKALLKWEKSICRLVQAGILAGEFRKDVNVRQLAVSIVAIVEGGIMMSRVTNDSSCMNHVLGTVEALISRISK